MAVKPTPAYLRVVQKVKVDGECWVYTGALNERGYGIVQLGRGIGTDRTHRVVYEFHRGPIPDGMTIDHLCANTACCNPNHLEVVTRAENTRRQWADGRGFPNGHPNAALTHCKWGHEFTPENTRIYNGRRHCRACARDKARYYRERKAA